MCVVLVLSFTCGQVLSMCVYVLITHMGMCFAGLVLDLDETLVHSSFKPVPNADFVVPIEIEGQKHHVYVLKRPFVDQFLQAMEPLYEVCLPLFVVVTLSAALFSHCHGDVRWVSSMRIASDRARRLGHTHTHIHTHIVWVCYACRCVRACHTVYSLVWCASLQVVLFTASLSKYADPVTDLLDPQGICKHRLFRQHCVFHRGTYVKDLSRLGRDLAHTVIVDNSPASYIFQPDNAIPCKSWFDNRADTELRDLIPFFEDLAKVSDVTKVLR